MSMIAEHIEDISKQEYVSAPCFAVDDSNHIPKTKNDNPVASSSNLQDEICGFLNEQKRYLVSIASSSSALEATRNECEIRGHAHILKNDKLYVFLGSRSAQKRVASSLESFVAKASESYELQSFNANEVEIEGFSFHLDNGKYVACISNTEIQRIKQKIRLITSRSRAIALDDRKAFLASLAEGLRHRFRDTANWSEVAKKLDGWLADRIRMLLWKQWKKVRSKVSALERFGVEHNKAMAIGSSRKGYWAMAQSDILKSCLTCGKLQRMGFSFLVFN